MTGTTKVLSMEDQPLASRVSTPIQSANGATSTGGVLGESSSSGGRPKSALLESPRKSQNQQHSQHSFVQQPIELNEKHARQSSSTGDDPRLALK